MIPLDLNNPAVLRRTLEEIEAQLIVTPPLANVEKLTPQVAAPTLEEVVVKVNEVIGVVNSVTSLINGVQATELS